MQSTISELDSTRLNKEDIAKQFHTNFGTLIDFNRSGTGLIEIVDLVAHGKRKKFTSLESSIS